MIRHDITKSAVATSTTANTLDASLERSSWGSPQNHNHDENVCLNQSVVGSVNVLFCFFHRGKLILSTSKNGITHETTHKLYLYLKAHCPIKNHDCVFLWLSIYIFRRSDVAVANRPDCMQFSVTYIYSNMLAHSQAWCFTLWKKEKKKESRCSVLQYGFCPPEASKCETLGPLNPARLSKHIPTVWNNPLLLQSSFHVFMLMT